MSRIEGVPEIVDEWADVDASEANAAGSLFARLDKMIDEAWAGMREGELWRHVQAHGMDLYLHRDLMVQIYHYTRFNSVNQAMTALRTTPEERALLRFAYRHADEELGHEMLVVHDLRAVGLIGMHDDIGSWPKVPATDALVNYLTGIALSEGAIARLGYSYWAEDVYGHIAPILAATRSSLGLTDRQLTFFVAHSAIDAHHSAEVRRIISKVATTRDHHDAIFRVAQTTLWLTTQLMEQTFRAWKSEAVHRGDR